MAEIIQFNKPTENDEAFVVCNCTPEGTPFLPIALTGEVAILSCLVCPDCESVLAVENGIIKWPE